MKKLFLFLFLIQFLFCAQSFGQIAKIIDTQGKVLVKEGFDIPWKDAKINMLLEKTAEIKTADSSECIIAFDEELENIMAIKSDSHIKLEDISPVKVFLPQGRVFSLIDDIVKIQDFQVRTPVAVAGVRGTGKSVEHKGNKTIVKCFKGKVNIKGQGGGQEGVGGGSGLEIIEGLLQDIFGLTQEDYEEWDYFVNLIEELRAGGKSWDEVADFLEDLRDDQRDDFHDDGFRDTRKDNEGSSGQSECEKRGE